MEYEPAHLFGITMVKIAVEKVGKNLYEALIKAIGLLEDAELSPQDRVLIKPDIVEPVPPKTRSITNPHLVDALAIVRRGLRRKGFSSKGVHLIKGGLQEDAGKVFPLSPLRETFS